MIAYVTIAVVISIFFTASPTEVGLEMKDEISELK
jgi:hypothetical protein